MDSSTSGRASLMNPGLMPVLCSEEPPRWQAASMRSRISGLTLSGRWNSMRVVTTLAPDSSNRHSTSISASLAMYSTQSGSRARISSMSRVATTPVGSAPHSSPASRPTLASEYTYSPTSSSCGWSITARNERSPMLPVAHCTTRYRSLAMCDPSPSTLRRGIVLVTLGG